MAVSEFVRTQLFPGTNDMAGLIAALIAHTWTHFSVQFSDSDEGLVLKPLADPDPLGPTNWQISLRRDGAGNFVTGIEPTGSINVSGNIAAKPGGITGSWSGETDQTANAVAPDWKVQSLTGLGVSAGSKYELIEAVDALALIITDPGNVFYDFGWHAGKIYSPDDVDDFTRGRDGLGWLLGSPEAPTTGVAANDWFAGSSAVTSYSSVVRTSNFDWNPVRTPISLGSISVNSTGPIVKPAKMPVWGSINRGTVANINLGKLKYLRIWHTSKSPKVRQESAASDTQAWLHINDQNATTRQQIMWEKGEVPA